MKEEVLMFLSAAEAQICGPEFEKNQAVIKMHRWQAAAPGELCRQSDHHVSASSGVQDSSK